MTRSCLARAGRRERRLQREFWQKDGVELDHSPSMTEGPAAEAGGHRLSRFSRAASSAKRKTPDTVDHPHAGHSA